MALVSKNLKTFGNPLRDSFTGQVANDVVARNETMSSMALSLTAVSQPSPATASICAMISPFKGAVRLLGGLESPLEAWSRVSQICKQMHAASSLVTHGLDGHRCLAESVDRMLAPGRRLDFYLDVATSLARDIASANDLVREMNEAEKLAQECVAANGRAREFAAAKSFAEPLAMQPESARIMDSLQRMADAGFYQPIHPRIPTFQPAWFPGYPNRPARSEVSFEDHIAGCLGAAPGEERACVAVYVPSKDRRSQDIPDRESIIERVVDLLVQLGGGSTLFDGDGSWKGSDGKRITERSSMVVSYIPKATLERQPHLLRTCLHRIGVETNQESIAFKIDGKFFLINKFD